MDANVSTMTMPKTMQVLLRYISFKIQTAEKQIAFVSSYQSSKFVEKWKIPNISNVLHTSNRLLKRKKNLENCTL